MKITIIGSGYVGLVTGACFAEMGNDVWCVDIDEKKIEGLRNGIIPIYEPGLEDMIKRNLKAGRIGFTTDLSRALTGCRVCFIAVGTPQDEDGSADIQHVLEVAWGIGFSRTGRILIVNKSTCPVGTSGKIREKIISSIQSTGLNAPFNIASNPEFLKEGSAIQDFMMPDRIIIGVDSEEAEETLRELYAPFQRQGDRIIVMDIKSAELTKYAANAMLATRISFMNEMAELCEAVGADIEHVREGIGSDSRIGRAFLYPGIGYGGSCFPKDVRALIKMQEDAGMESTIMGSVGSLNGWQIALFCNKILKKFNNEVPNKTLAVWGLSFKPNTDDVRESPAIKIIEYLRDNGATFQVFDPAAMETARAVLGDGGIKYAPDQYATLYQADALLLLTEWREFRNPDFDRVKALLKNPIIFDGRNQYDPAKMREMGFEYYCVGRP